jgi:hypothetical protein
MLYHLLTLVQSELNFSYTLIPSKDGKYGSKKSMGWTGQIGLLQKNELDLSITDLTVLFERSKVTILINKNNVINFRLLFLFSFYQTIFQM